MAPNAQSGIDDDDGDGDGDKDDCDGDKDDLWVGGRSERVRR